MALGTVPVLHRLSMVRLKTTEMHSIVALLKHNTAGWKHWIYVSENGYGLQQLPPESRDLAGVLRTG